MAEDGEDGNGSGGSSVELSLVIGALLVGEEELKAAELNDDGEPLAAAAADEAEEDADASVWAVRYEIPGADKVTTESIKGWPAAGKWRHEYSKAVTVQVSKAWLLQLHARPLLRFFLQETKADGSVQHYASWAELDASGLFVDDSVSAEYQWQDPAVESVRSSVAVPPKPFQALHIKLSVSQPLLDAQLVKELNPMVIEVKQAVDLPGVHMAEGDPSLKRFVTPTPFTLMRKHTAPVYACFRLFNGEALPRVVKTPAVMNAPNVQWFMKAVFFAGLLGIDQIQEFIKEQALVVELHDRDDLPDSKEEEARRERWEGILAGTWVDPDAAVDYDEDEDEDEEEKAENRRASMVSQKSSARASRASAAGQGEEEEAASKAMDVFDCDKLVMDELDEEVATAGDRFAHGFSELRMNGLLERGVERRVMLKRREDIRMAQLASGSRDAEQAKREASYQRLVKRCKAAGAAIPPRPADLDVVEVPPDLPAEREALMDAISEELGPLTMKQSVTMAPSKRRVIPKGGAVDYDLSAEERVTRQPGAYMLAESRLKLAVSVARPLHVQPPNEAPPPMPFERAVFCMKYNDPALLCAVLEVLYEVNQSAIPGVSLRSYQLTPEQQADAQTGKLDILTGFQMIDDKWRIVVVEGLSEGAMAKIHRNVPRRFANSGTATYLANPEVRFANRLYTGFHVAPKDIRLREPLSVLIESPEIYDRSKVTQLTFDALHRLYETRNASRIEQLKSMRLFPSVRMLLEIENKYGDTVTLQDMEGRSTPRRRNQVKASGEVTFDDTLATTTGAGDTMMASTGGRQRHAKRVFKAATVHVNPEFLRSLKERQNQNTDYVAQNRLAMTQGGGRHKTQAVDCEGLQPPGGAVYNYSGQKLNYTEWQKEMMRKRLASDKAATYTYSKDFQSLAVCLVNETEVEQLDKAQSKARWTTKRGFVYPAPRDPIEFARHPKAPSAARAEELRAPWDDPTMRDIQNANDDGADVNDNRPQFDTVPVRGREFGYLDPKTKKIDPDFTKSVFLSGDGLAAEEAAQKAAEEAAWRSKVVVDSERFMPHYSPKKATQLTRLTSMLDGPPQRLPLRKVHGARLPSGKRTAPPTAAPVSIFTDSEYEDPKDFTLTLKPNDPQHFVGTDATGSKVTFETRFHKDMNKPKSWRLQSKRLHRPIVPDDKTTPKWFPGAAGAGAGAWAGTE